MLDRSKIVAIITGAIALILGIAYLTAVQLLDRGELVPAPQSQLQSQPLASLQVQVVHRSKDPSVTGIKARQKTAPEQA